MSRSATIGSALAALTLAAFAAIVWVGLSSQPAQAVDVTVHKSPSCGCCGAWVDHLRASGFTVAVNDVEDLHPIKQRLGVPGQLHSCHTAEAGGYTIEGHVPAADIRRLLAEKPAARGLAVPGMPIGSPGMEQGDRKEPYSVVLFGNGGYSVWARH